MSEDYERKYNQLKRICRKQEEAIKKLQVEIRERCQSYLLHASRFKKSGASSQSSESMERESNYSSFSRLSSNFMEPIIKETVSEETQTQSTETSEADMQTTRKQFKEQDAQTLVKKFEQNYGQTDPWPRTPKLVIERSFQIKESVGSESVKYDSASPEGIIASFKERIAKIQQSKNLLSVELQQVKKSKGALSSEVSGLKKQLENSAKAQKRISSNVKNMPDCQAQVSSLYRLVLNTPFDKEGDMVEKLKVINKKLTSDNLEGLQAVSPQKSALGGSSFNSGSKG